MLRLEAASSYTERDHFTAFAMPKKIRQLVEDLRTAGFELISGGKGSHRKLTHVDYQGIVTLSGKDGDDAKRYQERQVQRAIEEVQR